jgi:hypothetical protein
LRQKREKRKKISDGMMSEKNTLKQMIFLFYKILFMCLTLHFIRKKVGIREFKKMGKTKKAKEENVDGSIME